MKNLIRDNYSGPSNKFPVRGGKPIVSPVGEVLSLGQIVALHTAGNDISIYSRSVIWGSEDTSHESLSFHSVANLDFGERQELIQDRAEAIESDKARLRDLTNADRLQKEADTAAAAKAAAEELEELRKVSRSSKYKKPKASEDGDE